MHVDLKERGGVSVVLAFALGGREAEREDIDIRTSAPLPTSVNYGSKDGLAVCSYPCACMCVRLPTPHTSSAVPPPHPPSVVEGRDAFSNPPLARSISRRAFEGD